jgi:hypothetical protein
MAKLKSGALGHFSGALGNIVGSTYKGKGIVRMKPAQVTDRKTPAQEAQRMRFGLVQEFLKISRPFIEIGYGKYSRDMSAVNAATSELLKNGVTGEFPALELSFPDIMVAKGSLTPPRNAQVSLLSETEVEVRWTVDSDRGSARPDDVPMVLLYNEVQKEIVSSVSAGQRNDGKVSFSIPEDYAGQNLHVWLAFRKTTSNECSGSVHVGVVVP